MKSSVNVDAFFWDDRFHLSYDDCYYIEFLGLYTLAYYRHTHKQQLEFPERPIVPELNASGTISLKHI